jgi:Flp pilus assembly protein TadG
MRRIGMQYSPHGLMAARPSDRRRGSQFVEAGLMLLPFLALAFMTMDAGWALFVKATLQHAVREGVRYGVTGQVSGNNGQIASIEAVAVSQAMGLLSGSQAGTLSVQFLDPISLAPTSNNAGGNIVQVSVTNYLITPLAPLLRSGAGIPVNVTAADVIEGSPGGIPPTP